MDTCKKCGGSLGEDGRGASLKFYDRSGRDFFCVPCLAEELKCTEEYLRERIEFLRSVGCSLFPKKDQPKP